MNDPRVNSKVPSAVTQALPKIPTPGGLFGSESWPIIMQLVDNHRKHGTDALQFLIGMRQGEIIDRIFFLRIFSIRKSFSMLSYIRLIHFR